MNLFSYFSRPQDESSADDEESEEVPDLPEVRIDEHDDEAHKDGEENGNGKEEDDEPPSFPLPNSIQRSQAPPPSSSSSSFSLPTPNRMMPPPTFSVLPPRQSVGFSPAPATAVRGNLSAGGGGGLALPPSTTSIPKRRKVALEPGHSQLDWGRLKSSGADLTCGIKHPIKVTTSMLAEHKTKEDAWTAVNGKVYNMTPFLKFHPGGVFQCMRIAGRDGTDLYMKTHAWVNMDFMMDACYIGILVRD